MNYVKSLKETQGLRVSTKNLKTQLHNKIYYSSIHHQKFEKKVRYGKPQARAWP
jgi:hypothetical protein